MQTIELNGFTLIGLKLKSKTSNLNGQSAIDCGNHWQEFEKGNYAAIIPGRLSDDLYAVYYDYDGDHTQPYAYFIGCKVTPGTIVPEELESLVIPKRTYTKIIASGQMPDCVANAWQQIWLSNAPRKYEADFEVYGEKAKDWRNAEVEIFISR